MGTSKVEPQGGKGEAGGCCYRPLLKGKATIWVQSISQQLGTHTHSAVF